MFPMLLSGNQKYGHTMLKKRNPFEFWYNWIYSTSNNFCLIRMYLFFTSMSSNKNFHIEHCPEKTHSNIFVCCDGTCVVMGLMETYCIFAHVRTWKSHEQGDFSCNSYCMVGVVESKIRAWFVKIVIKSFIICLKKLENNVKCIILYLFLYNDVFFLFCLCEHFF